MEAPSARNNGTVSELVQTKESKLEEKIGFPNVNTPKINLQQNPPSGNSVSVTEQESPAVSVLNETKSKEMSGCCPSVPFLSQNNLGLDIILSPLDNSSFKHACTPNDLSSQTVEDLRNGIEFAMEYAENSLNPQLDKSVPKGSVFHKNKESDATLHTSGLSTIDKRNRKKRKEKMICSQEKIPKITPEPHVQEFYKKYLANKFYKNGNNPTVINVNGFPVQYDNFYNSLEAVGNVNNEEFNVYIQVFNYDNECLDPKEIIPQFRQVVAYKLAKSDINEEEFHGLQEDVSTKKRRKHR
ncbi:hypothetical protein ZWY2020_028939 [Hordeum vulgare]|nr:hypothetical protein ZWY2020_028939 [Hordeum vulgare]